MATSELDLQFEYRDGQFVAFNTTHTLPITEAHFDFQDYHAATGTRVFPPLFQKLVQNALANEYNMRKKHVPFIQLKYYTGIYETNALQIIFDYTDLSPFNFPGFNGVLMPHQLEALDFALSHDNAGICLGLGLGKTATTLALLMAKNVKSALIICPASLKFNWMAESERFLDASVIIREIVNTKQAEEILKDAKCRIFVISYELLSFVSEHLMKYQWDVLVADESHSLKNSSSVRAKIAFTLRKKVKHVYLLTGTPSACTTHLWNLLRFLDPVIFADFFHYRPPLVHTKPSSDKFYFAERYVWPEVVYSTGARPRWVFKRSIRTEELHALTKQYIIRQRTEDILDLPPLITEFIVIGNASTAHRREYERQMQIATDVAKTKGDVYAQAIIGEQIRETARQKIPYVLKYLTTYLENENHEKFIVWGHSKEVIQAIHEHLDKLNVKHILINGDTNKKARPILLKQLENDPGTRVAVLSLRACGTGINLAFIHVAMYAELTCFYIDEIQSRGRIYRIGSCGDKVVLHYLVLKNTTDEALWKSMLRKTNVESIVLDNKPSDFLFDHITNMQNPDMFQANIDEVFTPADTGMEPSLFDVLPSPPYEAETKKRKLKPEVKKPPRTTTNSPPTYEDAIAPFLNSSFVLQPTTTPKTAQRKADIAVFKLPTTLKPKKPKTDKESTTTTKPAKKPRKPPTKKQKPQSDFIWHETSEHPAAFYEE